MQLPPFEPLAALARGKFPEIVIFGTSTMKKQGEKAKGSPDLPFLTRSLLNPWQFLACDVTSEDNFWTIGLSLHSGQPQHLESLHELSRIVKAGEEELICPREFPIDWEVAAKLKLANQMPSRWHHPNSGKHMLMLAHCQKQGFALDSYWDPSHPLQKKIYGIVGREAGEEVKWVTDGCGLPTAVMTMRAHLGMWEKLSLDDSPLARNLKSLWLRNPEQIGGKGRLDSELTVAAKGEALVKEGADGLIVVQSLPTGEEPVASLLVKLAGGYHRTHIAAALLASIQTHSELPRVFRQLETFLLQRLEDWLRPGVEMMTDLRSPY